MVDFKARFCFVLFIAILFPFTVHAGKVLPFVAHQAVYELSLKEATDGSGVQSARGRIVTEVDNQCDGYVLNQRTLVLLENVNGGELLSDQNLSTWEDKAGKVMRFSSSTEVNRKPFGKSDGIATLGENEGVISFTGEDGKKSEIKLPKGVFFPTALTQKILKSANEGKNLVSAKAFMGNALEDLNDILIVIGKKQFSRDSVGVKEKLKDVPYWHVQFTFFNLKEQSNEPDSELSLNLYENGVSSDLTLKYKEFSMSGELVQLDIKQEKKCN